MCALPTADWLVCFHALATHPTDTPCPLQWYKTALDVATNDEVKAALRQHGAKHSLLYAAEEGMLELVADLIKEGAYVAAKDAVRGNVLSLSLALFLFRSRSLSSLSPSPHVCMRVFWQIKDAYVIEFGDT
jgi:hypothetical protein